MRRNSSLHRANASNFKRGEPQEERESVYIASWGNLAVDEDEPESESVNSELHELSLLLLFGLLSAAGDSPCGQQSGDTHLKRTALANALQIPRSSGGTPKAANMETSQLRSECSFQYRNGSAVSNMKSAESSHPE